MKNIKTCEYIETKRKLINSVCNIFLLAKIWFIFSEEYIYIYMYILFPDIIKNNYSFN